MTSTSVNLKQGFQFLYYFMAKVHKFLTPGRPDDCILYNAI
jgi:hypothetical protein